METISLVSQTISSPDSIKSYQSGVFSPWTIWLFYAIIPLVLTALISVILFQRRNKGGK